MSFLRNKVFSNVFVSLTTSRLYSYIEHIKSVRFRVAAFFYCEIASSAKLVGWRNIRLGRNCVISSDTVINVGQRSKNIIRVSIGSNAFIGRGNFLSTGSSINLGCYTLTGPNCSFIGTSHKIKDPMVPYMRTGITNNWDINIGINCFFGYGASVLGNVSIGHGCVIAAHSVVLEDIPPFSIVVGNPGKVIKRFDFANMIWTKDIESVTSVICEDEYKRTLDSAQEAPFPLMPVSLSNMYIGDIT